MYRAKVEAVNGIKVRAGGKWLTCIGNKPVKVGDAIWTDGRCVYGNFQEAQTPIVITTKEEFIPLLFYDVHLNDYSRSLKESYHEFFKSSNVKEVFSENISKKSSVDDAYFINDFKKNIYVSTFLLRRDLVNVENTRQYDYTTFSTIAVNIDKHGNIYELRQKSIRKSRQRHWGGNQETPFIEFELILYVMKNQKIIFEIDLSENIRNNATKTEKFIESNVTGGTVSNVNSTQYPYTEQHKFNAQIMWGVIENENVWAIMLFSQQTLTRTAFTYTGRTYLPHVYYNTCSADKQYIELITPKKRQIIFDSFFSQTYINLFTGMAYHVELEPIADDVLTTIEDTVETFSPEEKLPIQDNYYFTIDEIFYYTTSQSKAPSYMHISIFSPNNAKLWTGKITFDTYLTIYKGFLLGVDDKGRKSLNGDSTLNNSDIQSGLYLLRDGQFTKIIDGYLKNQKLHPMKYYKNWWNKIQNLI